MMKKNIEWDKLVNWNCQEIITPTNDNDPDTDIVRMEPTSLDVNWLVRRMMKTVGATLRSITNGTP